MNENPVNAEVQSFNRNSLKKVETKTATGLPTKEEMEEEKKAMKIEQEAKSAAKS